MRRSTSRSSSLAFAIPNSLGQNALRPGVVLGPALLILFARPRAPRAAIVVIAVALLYLQWLPAVRAVEEARGDPSTQAAFHQEVLDFLGDRARPGERLEVPLTRNHWEATYLAQDYPLARGWHRQLDRKVNPLFYDPEPLTAERYRDWLRENAVRWVALPERAARLLRARRARAAARRPAVPRAGPRVGRLADLGGARHPAARLRRPPGSRPPAPTGSTWRRAARRGDRAPARHAVLDGRVEGDGCVSKDPQTGWTRVDVRRAGMLRVRAGSRSPRRCAQPLRSCGPVRTQCGQPPCRRPLSLASLSACCGRSPRFAERVLPQGWPDLLRQILLFCGAYWLYRLVRGLTDGKVAEAFQNARDVIRLEQGVGLFVEPAIQAWAQSTSIVIDAASWMYVNSHFAITTVTLAFIYLRRNERFYFIRNMFMVAMGIALVLYAVYPDRAAALHARVGLPGLRRAVHRR